MTPPPQPYTNDQIASMIEMCCKYPEIDNACENCEYCPKTGMRKGCCDFGDTDIVRILRSRSYTPQQSNKVKYSTCTKFRTPDCAYPDSNLTMAYCARYSEQPEPKFTRNCMCDKFTNCNDCQKHDEHIRQSGWDTVLVNLITWIRETKDMACDNLDYNYGTRGDRHVELILSQVLDKYNELRQQQEE